MKTNLTPWARATMTPEDWQTLRDAQPADAKVSAIVNHRTRQITLSVVHQKTLTHTGYGRTVREAWDARHEVEPMPQIVGFLGGSAA